MELKTGVVTWVGTNNSYDDIFSRNEKPVPEEGRWKLYLKRRNEAIENLKRFLKKYEKKRIIVSGFSRNGIFLLANLGIHSCPARNAPPLRYSVMGRHERDKILIWVAANYWRERIYWELEVTK